MIPRPEAIWPAPLGAGASPDASWPVPALSSASPASSWPAPLVSWPRPPCSWLPPPASCEMPSARDRCRHGAARFLQRAGWRRRRAGRVPCSSAGVWEETIAAIDFATLAWSCRAAERVRARARARAGVLQRADRGGIVRVGLRRCAHRAQLTESRADLRGSGRGLARRAGDRGVGAGRLAGEAAQRRSARLRAGLHLADADRQLRGPVHQLLAPGLQSWLAPDSAWLSPPSNWTEPELACTNPLRSATEPAAPGPIRRGAGSPR